MSSSRNLATMIAAFIVAVNSPAYAQTADTGRTISETVKTLDRGAVWKPVAQIPLSFPTFHPQGMVKIGDFFYVSSVEITTPTRKFDKPEGGYDRDTGEGKGHLFKIDAKGNLIADVLLGEGSIYHPGGIDFDGEAIFVPVAEYRPNSAAIVYRVDPATMKSKEVFRYKDHLGGLVHDKEKKTLNAVSWGSRRLYTFALDENGHVANADADRGQLAKLNSSHYIDYQDCKYLGQSEMLCGGLTNYQPKKDGPKLALGGLEVVNLVSNQPVYQIPVQLWTDTGLPMTQNPFWIEPTDTGLMAYFAPEDDKSTIYVYEVQGK
ncbi:hypothetical protein CU102_18070 [Phyllobacterium brassicacearum]|uniref:Phytase-like domain-containing protein n=1 Tax=Phyllobacterium brassicacearum TaxID=314235 RepID=A0A2P7BJS6_9HYPH|nr:DUF6454 family protein [Phyllobacterium brassicacearum]PSH66716.1 hypothetical protein CU102_18070 [Phyllobacterium brassicacearum]TDQ32039.1 hypothetical protein DEV91_106136 [Phyllobacterium brassicacearum]